MSKKRRSVKKEEVNEPMITVGMKQHLKYLLGLSVIAKVAIVILTVFVLNSGMDMYAISYYYERVMGIFQGNYPYISYYYEYPILLFVPVIIALIPSLIFNSVLVFMIIFSLLMILCDCITVICVYLIARKIWNDSKTAFIAAFIYLTALCAMYFVMISYDAFPSCLLMIGLTILFYGKEISGFSKLNEYSAIILGYFTKVYPAAALPFVVLYKSRSTSLKQEIISSLKVIVPISLVLVVPLFILNPGSVFKTYVPARMDIGYFPNTIIWTTYVWLHDIFKINIAIENVLMISYICMAIGFLLLFYAAFKYKKQEPAVLLKFILCAIMLIVLSFKVRSPGYVIWFTPFICILVADNMYKIGLFYITQILAYIEFPVTFWMLWTNIEYTNPIYSTNWYLALTLFTLEFSTILLLVWFAVEPVKLYYTIFKSD
jgi:hypothetical protein